MKKLLVLISVSCMLLAAGNVHCEETDLFASVKKSNTEHTGWSNFFIQSWAGKLGDGTGIDSAEQDPEYKAEEVFKVVGAGAGKSGTGAGANRVVCWFNNGQSQMVTLKPGKMYTFKARVKTKDVERLILVVSGPKGGEFKGIQSGVISGTNDWKEYVTDPFAVEEQCTPKYFNLDLWGPGTYWVSKISLIEAPIPPIKIKLPMNEYSVGDNAINVKVSLNKEVSEGLSVTAKITGKAGGKGGSALATQNMKPTKKQFVFPVDISKLKKAGEYEIVVGLMRGSKLIGKAEDKFRFIRK